MVSVVLPVYNERGNLAPLIAELTEALGKRPREIIAVDDASSDGSLQELTRLSGTNPTLRVIALRRHVGQSAAFAAGFDAAEGDVIVTMDADGQNDPADIPGLLDQLVDGCAAVVGYRIRRSDNRWKRFQSVVANGVRNLLTGDRVRDTGCSLKVMRRAAVRQMPRFDGMHRFFPTLIRLGGGVVIEAPVTHRPRRSGTSKYGMLNRIFVSLRDAIGIRWLLRRPLRYDLRDDVP